MGCKQLGRGEEGRKVRTRTIMSCIFPGKMSVRTAHSEQALRQHAAVLTVLHDSTDNFMWASRKPEYGFRGEGREPPGDS